MSAEFTGERVIPGQVDINLWNEHVARYAFAARLSRGRRVLDIGCGTGYGSAELASNAASVIGIDLAANAVDFARQTYPLRNLKWLQGSATALPFRDASFDLVVAFEVIEHLQEQQKLIDEARRLLAPGGQFIVSTPNRLYYAESRRSSGPNPFHEHEFEYEEFQQALRSAFPHVSIFLEDHTEGILFKSVGARGSADVRLEGADGRPQDANFFIAVCAMTTQTGAPTFVYLPSSANLLKERGTHIARLEGELAMKDAWLAEARAVHQQLVEVHRLQTEELQERNLWAQQLNEKVKTAGVRIDELQQELAREQSAAREMAEAYAGKVLELEHENAAKTEWALETERRLGAELQGKCDELAHCVELLDRAEKTVEERTNWALDLERRRAALEEKLGLIQGSRWIKLGRTFGLGPELRD